MNILDYLLSIIITSCVPGKKEMTMLNCFCTAIDLPTRAIRVSIL